MTLTVEQRQAVEKAGDRPVRIEDPESRATYVLLRAEVYDLLRPPVAPEGEDQLAVEPPEGIRRSKEAFLRDLPELLARKRLRGRWVLYHYGKRIGIWRNPQRMLRKSVKLGLPDDEIYYGTIASPIEEPEDVETSLFEFEEIGPSS